MQVQQRESSVPHGATFRRRRSADGNGGGGGDRSRGIGRRELVNGGRRRRHALRSKREYSADTLIDRHEIDARHAPLQRRRTSGGNDRRGGGERNRRQ